MKHDLPDIDKHRFLAFDGKTTGSSCRGCTSLTDAQSATDSEMIRAIELADDVTNDSVFR